MLIIGGAVLYFGAMISAFAYEPEHVVEIKETKMIARVDSFGQIRLLLSIQKLAGLRERVIRICLFWQRWHRSL